MERDLGRRPVLLFLDFDGTLTPIVRDARRTRLSPAVRRTLRRLVRSARCRVFIVSGRSLADVRRLTRLAGAVYVGNHGLEMAGPSVRFLHPQAKRFRRPLGAWSRRLARAVERFGGAWVERKGLSVSVHYRQVAPSRVSALEAAVSGEIATARRGGLTLAVRPGKKIWDIRPAVRWDKGRAAQWLIRRCNPWGLKRPVVIYIGDDRTDEDAFGVLRRAVTVRVTHHPSEPTRARYYTGSVKHVMVWLSRWARRLAD